MKKILVTGASGFIGRQSLPILQRKGFEVHAVSLDREIETEGVTWHHADLLDATDRAELMERVDPTHVLHFAWIATPSVYWTSPLNEHWKTATLDLHRLAREKGVERFVAAGSCAEYDWSDGTSNEETTPLTPQTPYGKAKAICSEEMLASAHTLSTAWGRIFHLYGPYENPVRLVPSVILSLLRGERAPCTHGKQVRDFLHVRDVADAFVALIESECVGAVNIGSGTQIPIRTLVETIGKQLDGMQLIDFDAIPAPSDPPLLVPALQRLRQEIGWKPTLTLNEGMAETISWWQTHGER